MEQRQVLQNLNQAVDFIAEGISADDSVGARKNLVTLKFLEFIIRSMSEGESYTVAHGYIGGRRYQEMDLSYDLKVGWLSMDVFRIERYNPNLLSLGDIYTDEIFEASEGIMEMPVSDEKNGNASEPVIVEEKRTVEGPLDRHVEGMTAGLVLGGLALVFAGPAAGIIAAAAGVAIGELGKRYFPLKLS